MVHRPKFRRGLQPLKGWSDAEQGGKQNFV